MAAAETPDIDNQSFGCFVHAITRFPEHKHAGII